MVWQIAVVLVAIVLTAGFAGTSVLFIQAKRTPDRSGQYVALGSSFAAGLGLGARAPGSPFVCMRSTNGYPQELARMMGLSLVDMSCSGSTTEHILLGGQVFLGPQLDALGPATQLVTITSGGNDVGYIGDLTFAAGSAGPLGKLFWKGPAPLSGRDFAKVTGNFRLIVEAIKDRAPKAKIIIVSYPPVVPPAGTCKMLGIDDEMAGLGRQVGERLLEATRTAAERTGAIFVDMASIGEGHHACSAQPWVNGAARDHGAPFHPNAAGAKATAEAIHQALFEGQS